jgi:hypothetical protein
VTSSETVENDCLSPGKRTPTLKVQEAWWNNFKAPAGEWALGKGEMNNANGWPTGEIGSLWPDGLAWRRQDTVFHDGRRNFKTDVVCKEHRGKSQGRWKLGARPASAWEEYKYLDQGVAIQFPAKPQEQTQGF